MSLSLLRKLSRRPLPTISKGPSSDYLTPAPDIAWERVGPHGSGAQTLFPELEQMYWDGVKNELEVILLTLKRWQEAEYSSVSVDDELDDFVHGFDTFIDQVSQERKEFADRYDDRKKNWKWAESTGYFDALCEQAKDMAAERTSSSMKAEVRDKIENENISSDRLERRARMLLQGAAFLDLEKVIEHRPPVDGTNFSQRPAPPQLTLNGYNKNWIPEFSPLQCSSCRKPIHGSMFKKSGDSSNICEDCYWSSHYGDPSYAKVYKHCILRKAVDSQASHRICRCPGVSHYDDKGNAYDIFPMEKEGKDPHIKRTGPGGLQCGLLELGEHVAEAKYQGMEGRFSQKKHPQKLSDIRRQIAEGQARAKQKEQKSKRPSRQSPSEHTSTAGSNPITVDKEAQEDLPFYLKRDTENPFGNVHMALRIGPLVIENGVAHTKGGALITTRKPPNMQFRHEISGTRSLTLSGDHSIRTLWSQTRPTEKSKRYKCMMKQVVGVPFCGLYKPELENEIIRELVSASKQRFDDPALPEKEQRRVLDETLQQILYKIIELMGSQAKTYLTSIASRLLDPSVNLGWNARTNNCQSFCDSLIDTNLFGALIDQNRSPRDPNKEIAPPLYLISFVCRPAGYMKRVIKSKFDVPNGLTEEYLLKYRYGRYHDADIIDTLQEYWHDWGAFNKTPYPFQDLFPWDCTEAYGKYPVKCGEFNIAKHIWAFPFDSWSIISLHLQRDRCLYPHTELPGATSQPLSDQEWMRNRLTVLTAQSTLIRAAAAMVQNPTLRATTSWLHKQNDPHLDRLKLGGIHRAQPFSHSFDHGVYHQYFIADWAHLKYEDQLSEYELLRDERMKMPDPETPAFKSPANKPNGNPHNGGGGGGGGRGGSTGISQTNTPAGAEFAFYVEFSYPGAGFTDNAGAATCVSNCGAGCGSTSGDCSGGCSGGSGGGGGGGCSGHGPSGGTGGPGCGSCGGGGSGGGG
ncbi:hypothetical protein FQN54_000198 [Arachnomyces sp. PD_36]|nr:hypothetical protein FQN54_000198 [Arachnomyces sp. PD_36]